MHSIKLSRYRMGIKFDKDPLAVEQKNYLSKILSVYIIYDLNACTRNPSNNFKFKNFFFGATARNVIIFGVDNGLSSHVDNCKNNFLVLVEGPTFGTNKN